MALRETRRPDRRPPTVLTRRTAEIGERPLHAEIRKRACVEEPVAEGDLVGVAPRESSLLAQRPVDEVAVDDREPPVAHPYAQPDVLLARRPGAPTTRTPGLLAPEVDGLRLARTLDRSGVELRLDGIAARRTLRLR